MKNREIADLFERIADMLELLGGNAFRINSYRKASRIIGDLTDDIADIAAAGKLQKLPGIGASTAKKIDGAIGRPSISSVAGQWSALSCRAWVTTPGGKGRSSRLAAPRQERSRLRLKVSASRT